jgi:Cu(I)/Ag(I) efflux system periplasmic protein CusF
MKTLHNSLAAALCLALLAPLGARAHDAAHKHASAAAPVAGEMTDAEVRKVDLDAGKITLKHAEIKSLDMPPMTMVFVVKDKAMIDKLKAGDKVRFKAVNDAGKYTVTDIQPAK